MNSSELVSKVLPFVLSGMRGARLPAGLSPLDAAALAAQALRFHRPSPPDGLLVEASIVDGRKTVSSFVGASLVTLFGSEGASEPDGLLSEAVVRALAAAGARLSPFDLPRLESFVAAHADELGAEALAFMRRNERRGAADDYFAPETLDDRNWTSAAPSTRARYVEMKRRRDPDGARALVEAVWATEPAEVRYRLLRAMVTGLTMEDGPFLASMSTDRSSRVKELSARLLARIPGARRADSASTVSYVVKSTRGILSRSVVLGLDVPLSMRRQDPSGWIKGAFSTVPFADLEAGLEMSEDEIVKAAASDQNLVLALMYSATAAGRLDLLESLCSASPSAAWDMLLRAEDGDLVGLEPEKRRRWVEAVATAGASGSLEQRAWRIAQLVPSLEGLASPALVERFLTSGAGSRALKDGRYGRDVVEALVVAAPADMRRAVREAMKDAGEETSSSLLYLDILENLENDNG